MGPKTKNKTSKFTLIIRLQFTLVICFLKIKTSEKETWCCCTHPMRWQTQTWSGKLLWARDKAEYAVNLQEREKHFSLNNFWDYLGLYKDCLGLHVL